MVLLQRKNMKGKEYLKRSKLNSRRAPKDPLKMERFFWENLHLEAPLYGCDIKGSLFKNDFSSEWNLQKLNSCLNDGLNNMVLEGINTPYIYFGDFRTMFAWHVEDLNLSSINFQHFGKPKFWYGISKSVIFWIIICLA